MADCEDRAAYRRCVDSQNRLTRPGVDPDAPDRVLSVRWGTKASLTVFVAVESDDQEHFLATLEMIGPLDESGALPRRCLLQDVWVRESSRRLGLARRLVGAAEERARRDGIGYLSLEVLGNNAAALALYEGLGFAEVDGVLSPLEQMIERAMPRSMRGNIVFGKALLDMGVS